MDYAHYCACSLILWGMVETALPARPGAETLKLGEAALSKQDLAAAPVKSQEVWTLESSIRRVLEVAPEVRAADAGVRAQDGALKQARAWPNPEIELRADDKIGKDEGTGGRDLTQLILSQSLSLSGRLRHQRKLATANLRSAQGERSNQRLSLEFQTASIFHALQLTMANLHLAEQRLHLVDPLQDVSRRRVRAGDLSRLEQLRIGIIRESAQQALDKAEGEFSEALSQFQVRLGLPGELVPELAPLEPFGSVPDLAELQAGFEDHPVLRAARDRLEAAHAGVAVARAGRWQDPVLRLFRERDFLAGQRQGLTGVGVTVPLPLWDRMAGRIDEAQAHVAQAESHLQALRQNLEGRLRQSHLHLTHLVQQGTHFRTQVFEAASELFELTRKAYAAGEADILSLIDAHDTYSQASVKYLELLQEAWLEAAELRLAAGRSLVEAVPSTTKGNQP